MHIINALSSWLSQHLKPQHKLLIAYSGGRDSHVLLDALAKLQSTYRYAISAIHINHGLQIISDSWESHCQQVCDSYGVSLHIKQLHLKILSGESLEEKARIARYQAFSEKMCEHTILLTAHTQDDQAETFVLQMMRGSGLKGLAGIAPFKAFTQGFLARPLLGITREHIAQYARQNNLTWIEDPSNQQLQLRRNYVRNKVLAPLDEVHANTIACIARSAHHCQQALSLLETYVEHDLAACLGESPSTIKVAALKAFSPIKQAYIVRLWLSKNQTTLPTMRKSEQLLHQLLHAKEDAQPQISWGQWQIRRYQGLMYLLPLSSHIDTQKQWQWDLKAPILLADGSLWKTTLVRGKGVSQVKLANQNIKVSYRQGGERCLIDKHTNSKSLKKVLQEFHIPPWERESLPLFYVNSSLVGVGQLFICKEWQVMGQEEDGICFEKASS